MFTSLRKQPAFGDATTSAEIPYWWHVTTQIWVVLLIGRATWEIWFNQSSNDEWNFYALLSEVIWRGNR